MMREVILDGSFECTPLLWDTEYFGVSSARVNLWGIIDITGQDEILEFCKSYRFVTIYNHNNVVENNNWIGSRTNAYLTDINVQFFKSLTFKPDNNDKVTYVVNNLIKNEQIIDIAKKSFRFSRFFNDPKLPDEKIRNIYFHWTESAFEQESKYFVISECKGNIAGYILFSIIGNCSVIELIAVDERFRGQNVGKSLIEKMQAFVLEKGINEIKVGTQSDNIFAVRFYLKWGFIYSYCNSIYHLWH